MVLYSLGGKSYYKSNYIVCSIKKYFYREKNKYNSLKMEDFNYLRRILIVKEILEFMPNNDN